MHPLKTPRLETVRATASAETLATARKDLSLPGVSGSLKKRLATQEVQSSCDNGDVSPSAGAAERAAAVGCGGPRSGTVNAAFVASSCFQPGPAPQLSSLL